MSAKVLVLVSLMLAAGGAEAQKSQLDSGGQTPSPSLQGLVAASDPQSIVAAMQAVGYTVTLGVDNVGDPKIYAELLGNTSFDIHFYGCTNNADCESLLFGTGYDLDKGWTFEAANAWNANTIISDAHLDESMDPFIEYFVTTEGGLTQANFVKVLEFWEIIKDDFEVEIGW